MALGMKISKSNSVQIDQVSHPQTITYSDSTNTTATVFVGGTGGIAAGVTNLVILVNYKTSAGVAKSDGQILKQKGSKTFNVQSAAGGVASFTRAVLTPVAPGSLTASQASIKVVAPDGTLFYASRISNRYVWNGTTRYHYVLGSTAAVAYIDTTSGVNFLNSAGDNEGPFAVVEGF